VTAVFTFQDTFFDAQHKPVVNATIEFYGERNRQMTTAVSISEDYWQRQVLM